jgi:hypothetical protein
MAFTATVSSINLQNDNFIIDVVFNDSATGYTSTKTYTISNSGSVTQASVVATITADGQAIKSNLTTLNQIQSRVGAVITI